jgi:hypothetical protein
MAPSTFRLPPIFQNRSTRKIKVSQIVIQETYLIGELWMPHHLRREYDVTAFYDVAPKYPKAWQRITLERATRLELATFSLGS